MLPTLQTSRLLLNAFTLDDAEAVQHQAGDAEVARTTANIPHPYPDGAAETWIRSHAPAHAEKGHVALAIREPNHGLIGAISLALETAHRRAEAGYWIGRPIGDEAMPRRLCAL